MTTITLSDGSSRTLPPADALAGSNCGTPGVWRFDSSSPGPHLVITALIHGNEVCGAQALWRVLQAGIQPARGQLTIVFCNLEAYARLTDASKDEGRLVDEDMNRVWGRLDGPATATDTYEVRRAREILPWVQGADVLLDLHSMTSPAPALGLVGLAAKNVDFAKRVGFPGLLIRDAGHAAGLRLIDRHPFGDPAASQVAMLIECGEHFSTAAFEAADEVVRRTISVYLEGQTPEAASPQHVIEVTSAITIQTDAFGFVRDWPNMSCVPQAGTLLGRDGELELRTPYDNTWLVMPASLRYQKPGLTAVRFGRKVEDQRSD
jgi:succinylglutamate desuccinylase